jgi:photosystem II stability/assembly factor-like uncharacterized protein
VPTTALEDVVFIDARRGFSLADHRDHLVLASTTDGGRTWGLVTGALPLSYFGSPPAQLEFTDAEHGYLWGGSAGSSQSQMLWITHDGGSIWHAAPLAGVDDVSAIDGNVWALSQSCAAAAPHCRVVADESADFGRHWSQVPVGTVAAGGTVELARITRSRAYVLTQGPASAAFDAAIAYSADDGASWTVRSAPCGPPFRFGAELAASGTKDLWLVCGGQGTAGNQPKQLLRSADGGATWSPSGGLPALGYVAPYAIGHKTLEVLSPSRAWLQPSRNDVSNTTDGGETWGPVANLQAAGFGTGAPGNLTFISASDGWVCELGVGLWHTGDGVHWSALGV